VLDVNDNWPKFTSASHVSVSEASSVGSSVFQLTATDADSGDAGRVRYGLVAGDGSTAFRVDSTDGVVRTRRQLDRETKDRYQLTIVATDSGTPRRSTSALVTVDVTDVNDHAPVFIAAPYTATVPEDSPSGTVVTTVRAVDGDLGLNAELRYDVTSGDDLGWFAQDGYGMLSVRRPLARRRRSEYVLTVVARDLGTPSLSATTTVTVSVVATTATPPRRPSPPVFRTPTYFSHVVENQPAPCHVTRVSADDVTVTYALADRDLSGLFAVNASTGHVVTAAMLDREQAATYTFNVIAVTAGEFNQSASHLLCFH